MRIPLLIALLFCGSAQAATQALTITGTIASVCAFTSVTNGIFGFEIQNPNVLDTGSTGGTNAQVIINYNSTPTVTVPEITAFTTVPSGFTDTVTFTNILTSSGGAKSYSNGQASWVESGSTVTDTITLRLRVSDGQGSFPTGNYSAGTVITCN